MEQEFVQQGIAKAKNGDYEAAILAFTQAIAINPQSAEAYYRRGLAYYDSGKIESAMQRSLGISLMSNMRSGIL